MYCVSADRGPVGLQKGGWGVARVERKKRKGCGRSLPQQTSQKEGDDMKKRELEKDGKGSM